MANNELDRLRTLADFADQVCNLSDNSEDARRRINHLVTRAEQDIKTKSLEIQMQQTHIALLKHLESFMVRAPEMPGQIRLGDTERGGPRVLAADGKQ